jgi:catechol-2,3-dioxygenase
MWATRSFAVRVSGSHSSLATVRRIAMLTKFWTNMMVDDIHETIKFYQRTLGFEHVMSVPKDSGEALFQ